MDNDAARSNEKESSAADKIKPPSLITTGQEKRRFSKHDHRAEGETDDGKKKTAASRARTPDDRLIVWLLIARGR